MCIDADSLALMLTITTLEYNVRQTQHSKANPVQCKANPVQSSVTEKLSRACFSPLVCLQVVQKSMYGHDCSMSDI